MAHQPPVTIPESATVTAAVQVMMEGGVSSAVVVGEFGVSGMLTERDLVVGVIQAERDPHITRVRDVMTSSVFTLSPDAPPEMALEIMGALHFRHLPVVDGSGAVVGVVSFSHLMRAGVADLNQTIDSLKSYIGTNGMGA